MSEGPSEPRDAISLVATIGAPAMVIALMFWSGWRFAASLALGFGIPLLFLWLFVMPTWDKYGIEELDEDDQRDPREPPVNPPSAPPRSE